MTAFLCLHSLQGISSCSQVGSLRTQTTEEDRSTDREYHLGKQKEKRATMTSVFFFFFFWHAELLSLMLGAPHKSQLTSKTMEQFF